MSNGKSTHIHSTVGPNMDDVPFGKPEADYSPPTIGQGLLDLAAWFDIYDDRNGYTGDRTVQKDLRAWAARTMEMPAQRTTVENISDRFIKTENKLNHLCKFCGTAESENWWKCCPEHTSEQGPDVVCDKCKDIRHLWGN